MCISAVERALKGGGVPTKFLFAPLTEGAQLLSALCPHGRAALIYDEECPLAEQARAALAPFRPACFRLEQGAPYTPLFGLDDTFRAAVGVGERSMAAARFFATVRGGFSLLVPLRPSARGAFERCAPAPCEGYPLREADIFLAPPASLFDCPQSRAEAALAALCAEELRCDALFSGREREASPFDEAATLALGAGGEEILCASALSALALRGAPTFACFEAYSRLRGEGVPAFALFSAFSARYCAFHAGEPRPFYVPDYAARVRAAARRFGVPERDLYARLHVPRGAESFALSRIFFECRAALSRRAQLLAAYVRKVSRLYFAAGGGAHRAARAAAEGAYELSAELSPLLSPPALGREMGMCMPAADGPEKRDPRP